MSKGGGGGFYKRKFCPLCEGEDGGKDCPAHMVGRTDDKKKMIVGGGEVLPDDYITCHVDTSDAGPGGLIYRVYRRLRL